MVQSHFSTGTNSHSRSIILHRPLTLLSALLLGIIASLLSLLYTLPFAPPPATLCPSQRLEKRMRRRPASPSPPPSPTASSIDSQHSVNSMTTQSHRSAIIHPLHNLVEGHQHRHLERVDESDEDEWTLESSSVEGGGRGSEDEVDTPKKGKCGKRGLLKRLHVNHPPHPHQQSGSLSPESSTPTSTPPKSPRQSKSFFKSLFHHRTAQDSSSNHGPSSSIQLQKPKAAKVEDDKIPFVRTRDLSHGHDSPDGSKSLDLDELLEGWAARENMRHVSPVEVTNLSNRLTFLISYSELLASCLNPPVTSQYPLRASVCIICTSSLFRCQNCPFAFHQPTVIDSSVYSHIRLLIARLFIGTKVCIAGLRNNTTIKRTRTEIERVARSFLRNAPRRWRRSSS